MAKNDKYCLALYEVENVRWFIHLMCKNMAAVIIYYLS